MAVVAACLADTAAAAELRTVTLISGDQVVVAPGPRVVDVRPAPGRRQVRFLTQHWGKRLHVVPADAIGLVASGRLDRRLFDVGRLADLDQPRTLPLIVQYDAAAGRRARPARLRPSARLEAIRAEAFSVGRRAAGSLWAQLERPGAGPVRKVWLDGERRLALDVSTPMVRAPEAWSAGYTGRDTTVAVLDSGIDATHADLADAIVEARNFTAAPSTDDTVGHGTHVASIITGSGSASSGRYQGVAPDARLLVGKVCADTNCADSAILEAMQWAAESGADVVNLSLGGPDTPELDPLEQAVEQLTEEYGVLFVAAVGNDGDEGVETIASPASADAALAVGSVTKAGAMSFSSGQGPRRGDGALKPDIVAPGVGIVAARAANGWMGSPVDDRYTSIGGTSMAAPHVAGAAAILAQQHPQWTPGQIKAQLMGAADPLPGAGAFLQGGGLLDAAEAISLPVIASPAGVSFGVQRWPHDDDEPITRTVTYRNLSDQPVTLGVALRAVGPDGRPAPAGMFRLDSTTVTVPAGGTSAVALTADTRVPGPDGHYSGWIVATGGATELTTPFGVDRSIEAYDVTFEVRGRDGAPTADYQLAIGRYDDEFWLREPHEADGRLTVRLPAGRYYAIAQIAGDSTTTLLTMPDLRADADRRVDFDARAAKPISITVPEPSARLVEGAASAAVMVDSAELGQARRVWSVAARGSWSGVFIGRVGAPVARERFQSTVSGVWARPKGDGTFDDSPYVYNFGSFAYGSMPNGFDERLRERDFAQVRAEYDAQGGSSETAGWLGALGRSRDGRAFVWFSPNLTLRLPGARREYFSTDDIEWTSSLLQVTPVEGGGFRIDAEQNSARRPYRAGRRYSVRWNGPVFGPSFAENPFDGRPWARRTGNELSADIRLFSDGNLDHVGGSVWDTGRTVLYRDGELVFESEEPGFAFAELPPERARYRLDTVGVRSLSGFSTEVRAAWTFQSEQTEELTALPLAAIRFLPRLDDDGEADAGRRFRIPVAIQWQTGAPYRPLRRLDVDVSYDGGDTWAAAEAIRHGRDWSVRVRHPRRPDTVSLRATATDYAGGSAELTIVDAYAIR